MAIPNVGGPGQTDGQPIRMTGEQVGGKGADGNFHIFSTDNQGVLQVNTGGGFSTISENLTQWASSLLGTPTNFGTSPGAVIAGSVNSSIFSGTTALTNTGGALNVAVPGTVAVTQSTSPWVVGGTVTSNIGTTGGLALDSTLTGGTAKFEIFDGTNILGTSAHPVRIDPTGTTVQPVSGSVSITGTVAVTQSTSPWVVSGTVTVNQGTSPWVVSLTSTTVTNTVAENLIQVAGVTLGATAVVNYGSTPAAVAVPAVNAFITNTPAVTLASTTITGTVAVTQSTSPWVVSLASTTITNTVAENLTQWASTVLGTPTNFGTTPGAVIVGSVNASLFSGTTALTNTGGSLNVNLTSGTVTITGAVSGSLTNNNAAPAANNIGVLPAIAETSYSTVTYITGNQVLPVTDLHGALNQDLQAYAGTQLTGTVTAYGTAPTGNVFGVNAFITNTVPVTLASTTITGTVAVTQSTSPWVVSLASTTVTNTVAENLIQVAGVTLGATAVTAFGTAPAAANVPGVNASLFAGTTGLTATGTSLNANITNTVPVTLTSTTITGTVVVVGNKANNSVAPGSTNLGVLPGIANAATQTWTEGDQVLESMDLSGRQRIRGTLTPNTAAPSSDGQMALTTIANAAAPTYTEGNLVLASVDLGGATRIVGTRTNNNAAPSFQVGVIPAVANAAAPTWTEGNQVVLSVDLAGNLRTNAIVTGAAAADAAAVGNPVLVAGVDGSGNVQELPVADANTVAPAQTLITGGVFNTVEPAITSGNVAPIQLDSKGNTIVVGTQPQGSTRQGSPVMMGATKDSSTGPNTFSDNNVIVLQTNSAASLFVKPYRRNETIAKATTISLTLTAATVVAASGSGLLFTDLCSIFISTTPAATTALVFTATLSDGTASYIFDMDTGTVASSVGAPINITFNPPLKATTANVIWTLQLSVNTVTVHVTTVGHITSA
jgi:hypothetical protein